MSKIYHSRQTVLCDRLDLYKEYFHIALNDLMVVINYLSQCLCVYYYYGIGIVVDSSIINYLKYFVFLSINIKSQQVEQSPCMCFICEQNYYIFM